MQSAGAPTQSVVGLVFDAPDVRQPASEVLEQPSDAPLQPRGKVAGLKRVCHLTASALIIPDISTDGRDLGFVVYV